MSGGAGSRVCGISCCGSACDSDGLLDTGAGRRRGGRNVRGVNGLDILVEVVAVDADARGLARREPRVVARDVRARHGSEDGVLVVPHLRGRHLVRRPSVGVPVRGIVLDDNVLALLALVVAALRVHASGSSEVVRQGFAVGLRELAVRVVRLLQSSAQLRVVGVVVVAHVVHDGAGRDAHQQRRQEKRDGGENHDQGRDADQHVVVDLDAASREATEHKQAEAQDDEEDHRGRHTVLALRARLVRVNHAEDGDDERDEGEEHDQAVQDEANDLRHALDLVGAECDLVEADDDDQVEAEEERKVRCRQHLVLDLCD